MQTLRQGDRGEAVRQLQVQLKAVGKDPGDVDGVFGPATAAAVRDFQDDHDALAPDAIVGPETWGALRQALEFPGLFELCSAPNTALTQPGVGTWRGYGDLCRPFVSDGSSRHRTGVSDRRRAIDLKELWERREELPTFFVCGQSSRTGPGTWKWWHHTLLFVTDHRQPGSPLYRIAADGMVQKASKRWSSKPMVYRKIDEAYVEEDIAKRIYRGYTVHLPEVFDRPVAPIVLEP
jgi:hypothetical protein